MLKEWEQMMNDFVETILTTSTHDMVLFFTNTGKVYKAKAYEIPE